MHHDFHAMRGEPNNAALPRAARVKCTLYRRMQFFLLQNTCPSQKYFTESARKKPTKAELHCTCKANLNGLTAVRESGWHNETLARKSRQRSFPVVYSHLFGHFKGKTHVLPPFPDRLRPLPGTRAPEDAQPPGGGPALPGRR